MTETLHYVIQATIQFPIIFIHTSIHKQKINSFLKTTKHGNESGALMVKQGHSIDERKSAALMVKQTTV
jgi:hypothetical protein